MEISFRPTKEYIVEGEILVIDPHYLLDENVVKVIEDTYYDENSLLPSSGVIGIDGKEFFVFPAENGDGNYEVKVYDSVEGEITTDSGAIAFIKKETAVKLSKDKHVVDAGHLAVLNERDAVKYKGSGKVSGPIVISNGEDDIAENWLEDEDEY